MSSLVNTAKRIVLHNLKQKSAITACRFMIATERGIAVYLPG